MSQSPYLCRRDEDEWVSRDQFDISSRPSKAMEMDLMSTKSMLQTWCERVQNDSVILNFAPLQYRELSFDNSKPAGSGTVVGRKRQRPLSDVDGESSRIKKKRRLRLYLITSRLSRPFSSPATYIYDRDRSKSAWARNSIDRGAIWKAAMVNRYRIRTLAIQRKLEQQQCQRAIVLPNCRQHRPALRPSPLGQSHYTAPPDSEDEGGPKNFGYEEDDAFDSDDEDSE